MQRSSGILLHPTSLPGKFGCGSFGKYAYQFLDILESNGQKIWQILPLGPTDETASPYQSYSSYAGNILLIDLELLEKEGLFTEFKLEEFETETFCNEKLEYKKVYDFHLSILQKAFLNFKSNNESQLFYKKNKFWLDDYAFFMALNQHFGGVYFINWPKEIRNKEPQAIFKYKKTLHNEIEFHKFCQFQFFVQYKKLKDYAKSKNIKIIGDIPIYVSANSVDAWANPELFELSTSLKPTKVAGVPPDYFSQTGQRWGNPVYKWKNHKINNYAWWVDRLKFNLDLFDIVRIDHFRAFEAFWSIPASEETAINGKWIKGPNHEIFEAFSKALGKNLPIIAEDLGIITPAVEKLRDDYNLPGMKILEFGFGSGSGNGYLPHNFNQNCVVYTGTHDNDTLSGWMNEIKSNNKYAFDHLCQYLQKEEVDGLEFEIIKLAVASVARMAIFPMQDILKLDTNCRMNIPGTIIGNWLWRMSKSQMNDNGIEKLKILCEIYGR